MKPKSDNSKEIMKQVSPIMLDNRYKIIKTVNSGAMGCVYKAIDTRLDVVVAVKKMISAHNDSRENEEAKGRFKKEAEILSHLHHNGIPRVSDYFTCEDPHTKKEAHYIVMTFIEGIDLETLMQNNKQKPMPFNIVLDYFRQVLEILNYLHSQEPPVIYRDLKPSNIMLKDGRIYLVDFGIARIFKPGHKGTMIGTPGYAAPEQYKGYAEPGSDLYSLGAVVNYLLTGIDPLHPSKAPFEFEPVRNIRKDIPEIIEKIIMAMLDIIPANRPPSAIAILNALDKWERHKSSSEIKKQANGQKENLGFNNITELFHDINKTDETGMTPLHKATREGNLESVKSLILKGADLNIEDPDGLTPLHYAAYGGFTKTVEFLIDNGAYIDTADNKRWTPLHYSSYKGDREMTELLLNKGARMTVREKTGNTPLHLATLKGNKETVELFITRGMDINLKNRDGWTPLDYAVKKGHGETADLLKIYGGKEMPFWRLIFG